MESQCKCDTCGKPLLRHSESGIYFARVVDDLQVGAGDECKVTMRCDDCCSRFAPLRSDAALLMRIKGVALHHLYKADEWLRLLPQTPERIDNEEIMSQLAEVYSLVKNIKIAVAAEERKSQGQGFVRNIPHVEATPR